MSLTVITKPSLHTEGRHDVAQTSHLDAEVVAKVTVHVNLRANTASAPPPPLDGIRKADKICDYQEGDRPAVELCSAQRHQVL